MHRVVRALIGLLALLVFASSFALWPAATRAAEPGNAEAVTPSELPEIEVTSTINGMQVGFVRENNATTIWLRICSDAPNFQMRSEQIGAWRTEIFHRTAASGGCSPSPTSWWKMVVGAQPNTGERFIIYGTANDAILGEAEFMRRASRTECWVTGPGRGDCKLTTPKDQLLMHSAPSGSLDSPAAGTGVQGSIVVSGWAVDAGAWVGTGVNAVQVLANGRLIGAAEYGIARPDVAAAVGDSRFTNSGFRFTLNTAQITNGAATLTIRYRSAISGDWTSIDRAITVANATVGTPVPQPPVAPPPQQGDWQVPYYSQGDPRWGGARIGACNNTIRDVGCALTSLAMIYRHYGVDHTPGSLNSCLGGLACPLNWSHSRVATCSASRVRWVGWPGFSYDRLQQELRNGPVILEIRNSQGWMHFIVVLGGSGSDPRNYRVHDPGIRNGANTTLANTLAIFRGYTPAGMRIYTGTRPATTMRAADPADADVAPLTAPTPSQATPITGAIALYRNTETEMVLELAAQSSAGDITAMRVWTEQNPSEVWQPFAQYVSAPLDTTYYVQFRDSAGNTSAVFSTGVPTAPETIQDTTVTVYLPLLQR